LYCRQTAAPRPVNITRCKKLRVRQLLEGLEI
jgi:hypothetical protein